MFRRLAAVILTVVTAPSLITAAALPKASEQPAVNLQHYLEYRLGGEIAFACSAQPHAYRCLSKDQKLLETAEDNSTAEIRFKTLELRFGSAVALLTEKGPFQEMLEEMRRNEVERDRFIASNTAPLPLFSPRKDALDHALIGHLERFSVDDLAMSISNPHSSIRVGALSLENHMKKTAKGVAFSERILGQLRLEYRDVVADANGSDAFYRSLPMRLEAWLETNDSRRATYVAQRLEHLYAGEIESPIGGRILIETRYLGRDSIALTMTADHHNTLGMSGHLDFNGELRGVSSLFAPARQPSAPGLPDFLFRTMHADTTGDGGRYRALLKSDKLFSSYIHEYDALIRTRFDRLAAPFSRNAVVTGWFAQAKTAFSKLFTGEADTLALTVANKNGLTLLQVFNLLMSRLAVLPQPNGALPPDPKALLTDTAADHLDIRIEAR